MSAGRLWLLLLGALRETAHLRLAWALAVAALGLVAGGALLREINFGLEEPRFFQGLTEGALMLFGSVQAIWLTVTMVHGGLDRGTPALLFVRGVSRSEWLIARLLAVWVSLAWLALGACALLALQLSSHGYPVPVADLTGVCGLALLRLGLIAAFSLLMSAVSRSPFLAVVLSLSLALAAQLAPVIVWAASHGGGAGRVAWSLLAGLVPDFGGFVAGAGCVGTILSAASQALIYTLTACLAFSCREL